MKVIEVAKSSARIVTNAGLSLVGAILDKAGFHDKCNQLPIALVHPGNQISCADVFATAIGTMCSGSPSFEASHEFDDDKAFYQDALGIGRSHQRSACGKGLTRLPWAKTKGLGFTRRSVT